MHERELNLFTINLQILHILTCPNSTSLWASSRPAKKKMFGVRKHLVYIYSEYFIIYISPEGSFLSTGNKLFCSNIARILPWGSVSSLRSKTLFPARVK